MSSLSSQTLLFVIVGRNEPLYEAELRKSTTSVGGTGGTLSTPSQQQQQQQLNQTSDAITRQNYFVLHSALDLVEKSAWTTSNMYLKVVDKVNQQMVSTFLTAANIKFMLVHTAGGGGSGNSSNNNSNTTGRNSNYNNEESIRLFFQDVYELYVKVSFFCVHNAYMILEAFLCFVDCL